MTTDMTNAAQVAELARGARESLDADLAEKSDEVMVANIVQLQGVACGRIDLNDFLCDVDDAEMKSIFCTALTTITESYAKRLSARLATQGPELWESVGIKCKKCGAEGSVTYRSREDDAGHDDDEYHCSACDATWFIDGIDS